VGEAADVMTGYIYCWDIDSLRDARLALERLGAPHVEQRDSIDRGDYLFVSDLYGCPEIIVQRNVREDDGDLTEGACTEGSYVVYVSDPSEVLVGTLARVDRLRLVRTRPYRPG
jgi:hypothetical protein